MAPTHIECIAHLRRYVLDALKSDERQAVPLYKGRLQHPKRAPIAGSLRGADLAVDQWVYDKGTPAGLGTDTLPATAAQYQPLIAAEHT